MSDKRDNFFIFFKLAENVLTKVAFLGVYSRMFMDVKYQIVLLSSLIIISTNNKALSDLS